MKEHHHHHHHHNPNLPNLENASEFRKFIFDLTQSKIFGGVILFVILTNTVILVTQTDEGVSVKAGWYFSALDNVFLAIYIMELVLKLYALGSCFFKTGWNVMDFFIVIFTTVDFLLPLIMENVGSFDVAAIFRLLRMFRAIRALRALRVLRTIRFLKNLQVIMTTILKSFRALSTIVMLQTLFLYMFAVIGRGLFYEVAPLRFGTLGKAFFTLFQLITLDDWFFMYSDVISRNPNYGFIILYLIIYIVLENFIFMNLFVAVLVDNFQRTLSAAEEKKMQKRTVFQGDDDSLQSEFSFSDSSGDEELEDDEMMQNLEAKGIKSKEISDYYTGEKHTYMEIKHLKNYLILVRSLEYSMYQLNQQQRTLDDLVDMTINIPDIPEDVI